jgi:hypothetical protein
MTTIDQGETGPTDGIERHGKLLNVRQFNEHNDGAAIEILVELQKAVYSTVLRLDESAAIADLFTLLDGLHGYSLAQIGEVELSRNTSRIIAKEPQSC